jgi:colicin import membrane protein
MPYASRLTLLFGSRRRGEAARDKEHKQRQQAIAKAERALEQAQQEHEVKANKFNATARHSVNAHMRRNARWEKQKEKLESAVIPHEEARDE